LENAKGTPARQCKTKSFSFSFALLSFIRTFAGKL